MATLIPSLGSCKPRMTGGERRLAERLEQQLDEDYLLWYDVPIGPKQTHLDFVALHPRRGLLILETKHWRLGTILSAPQRWDILADGRPKTVIRPPAQARHCAIQVVNALERDAQLVQASGPPGSSHPSPFHQVASAGRPPTAFRDRVGSPVSPCRRPRQPLHLPESSD
jgi:hypothetical protein